MSGSKSLLSESVIQNLLSSLALCSCGPTLTLGKAGIDRIHFKSAPGLRFAGVIHGIFESTGIMGICAVIRHYIPNLRTTPGLRTQLEKEGFVRFCLISEPEVIENASAAKQDTSGKALIRAYTLADITVKRLC